MRFCKSGKNVLKHIWNLSLFLRKDGIVILEITMFVLKSSYLCFANWEDIFILYDKRVYLDCWWNFVGERIRIFPKGIFFSKIARLLHFVWNSMVHLICFEITWFDSFVFQTVQFVFEDLWEEFFYLDLFQILFPFKLIRVPLMPKTRTKLIKG